MGSLFAVYGVSVHEQYNLVLIYGRKDGIFGFTIYSVTKILDPGKCVVLQTKPVSG